MIDLSMLEYEDGATNDFSKIYLIGDLTGHTKNTIS
jgi:hypothetical protein